VPYARFVAHTKAAITGSDRAAIDKLGTELSEAHSGYAATPPMSGSLSGADALVHGGGAWAEADTLWMAYLIVAGRGTIVYALRLAMTCDCHLAQDELTRQSVAGKQPATAGMTAGLGVMAAPSAATEPPRR
jgi:hypothetical protein